MKLNIYNELIGNSIVRNVENLFNIEIKNLKIETERGNI